MNKHNVVQPHSVTYSAMKRTLATMLMDLENMMLHETLDIKSHTTSDSMYVNCSQ